MISNETIEEVKRRAKLIEIVAETIALKRTGGRSVGLCPFHSEKSPSFHVKEDDNYFHCFGCGKSGNIFSFLMETRGLSFPEAVEYLADKYGIEIKRTNVKIEVSRVDNKKELFALNDFALDFFLQTLQQRDPKVIQYAKERGLTKDSFQNFHIGFAPLGNGFIKAARGKFSEDLLLKSGLIRRNEKGTIYDALRGRLVFPIFIDPKRIAGFGGRIVPGFYSEDEKPPKYLNSPETEIYHKSSVLYGLPYASDSIRQTGEVYVVEGYMDVIGLWQVGVKNVVATCGTSLTEEHVKKLSRLAKKVTMLFDGDTAGRAAAGKSFKTFAYSPVDVWALYLPSSEDPDSIAKSYQDKTSEYLGSLDRVSLLDAFIDFQLAELKASNVQQLGPSSIGTITSEIKKILTLIKDQALVDVLTRQACHRLRITESAFLSSSSPVKLETLVGSSQGVAVQQVFNDLPALDKQVLQIIFGNREKYLTTVLRDSIIFQALSKVSQEFLMQLSDVMQLTGSLNEKNAHLKGLVVSYGASWVLAWKQGFRMKKEANLDKLYQECQLSVARQVSQNRINQLLRNLEVAVSDDEKVQISQELLMIKRQA